LAFAFGLGVLSACDKASGDGKPVEPKSETPLEAAAPGSTQNSQGLANSTTGPLTPVKDPIQELIRAFNLETRSVYNDRKFDQLEQRAASLRAAKETFGNGSWKIFQFYQSFHCGDDEPDTLWQLHDRIHQEWIAAKPESVTAKIAYADFLADYAWRARGTSYANKVTQDGWKVFGERLAAAGEVLKEATKLPDKDPMLARVFMTVALGQGWPKPVYDTLLEKARAGEPTFFSYEIARAYSLLPRWYGEPGEWEAFADEAAARPNGLGLEIYARIVMEQRRYHDNVFGETKASWPKTREGLEILRKKYPEAVEFVNATALLAALAKDRELSKQMFDQLGDTYVVSFWRKPERFARFRDWARTGKW
jgi:hypothetical protein